MQTQNELVQEDEASLETVLSEEDKFRHEIEYLRGRVSNLESFKEKFFALQKKVPKAAASVVESVIDTQQVSKLEADLKNATNMAMLSMTTTGEYGTVVDFFKESVTSKDYQSLIDVFFSALSNYGLQSTVLLMALDSEQMYSQNEETQDSDIELIREYKDLGRIYEHEDMLFINDKHVSFLVRGLSFDDQEKKGRLQDNLVILASGLTERIDALNLDIKMGRQRQNLHTIVKAIPKVIDKIEQDLGAQLNKTDGMCDRVIANMGSMIKDQGLGAEKEKELCGLLITHKHQLHKILAESIVIAEQFAEIMNTLERTYVSSAESDSSVETSAETSADVLFENDKAVTESVIF